MSVKKASDVFRKTNLLSNIVDKTGISHSNAIVRITNPADEVLRAGQERGTSGITDYAKSGDATDPGSIFHNRTDAPTPDPGSVPAVDGTDASMSARDRARRLAYRAQGRSSTILVNGAMQPYSGQPQALIGS